VFLQDSEARCSSWSVFLHIWRCFSVSACFGMISVWLSVFLYCYQQPLFPDCRFFSVCYDYQLSYYCHFSINAPPFFFARQRRNTTGIPSKILLCCSTFPGSRPPASAQKLYKPPEAHLRPLPSRSRLPGCLPVIHLS